MVEDNNSNGRERFVCYGSMRPGTYSPIADVICKPAYDWSAEFRLPSEFWRSSRRPCVCDAITLTAIQSHIALCIGVGFGIIILDYYTKRASSKQHRGENDGRRLARGGSRVHVLRSERKVFKFSKSCEGREGGRKEREKKSCLLFVGRSPGNKQAIDLTYLHLVDTRARTQILVSCFFLCVINWKEVAIRPNAI